MPAVIKVHFVIFMNIWKTILQIWLPTLCFYRWNYPQLSLKCCANAIRSCRNQLSITSPSRCEPCLKIDREKDHTKRGVDIVKTETEKQCSVCCKLQPLESFQGKFGETKTCLLCRKTNQRADKKREKEHVRELANQNAKKPERKELRQIVSSNKLTQEQKREKERIRKQAQRDALRKKIWRWRI